MLVVHKNLEGVLVIDSKKSYSFPAKEQKIIAGLANQMAWELDQEKKRVLFDSPKWSEAQPFKIKLEKILNNTLLFVEGGPMQICAELGMSCFPDNGKTISQLIGASLQETTSEFFSKITTTL